MDSEKIIQELNQRFSAPLPEFYKRRIIVWYDEDREFEDKLDEIILNNATLVPLTGSNSFVVKKLIAMDNTKDNLLVYCPVSHEHPEDNWLMDVEMYSEEFRADLISIWMDELGLPSTPAMRKLVKEYRKFFNAKARRDKLAGQSKKPAVPMQLHLAVMAALGGLKDANPVGIIHEVLRMGTSNETNALYRDLVGFNADKAFWSMVAQGTGYSETSPSLMNLATHLLITAATRTMRMEYLAGLDSYISIPHQAFCYDVVSDWLHGPDADALQHIAMHIEDDHKLAQRFTKLEVEDLVSTEVFPSINEVILRKLMTEISDHIIDVDVIRNTVEKRRTCVWYEEVQDYYDGLLQVANMQAFFKEHSGGFHTVEAKNVWKEYTSSYYKMDTWYRLFHKAYANSLKAYNSNLHDLYTQVQEKVEGLYGFWFLTQLGNNWSSACEDDLRDWGYIPDIPQQRLFYQEKVKPSDSRMFVIISDAMRYEVAAELADQLTRETQSQVKLSSMQSVFPSITKFGMAALLPNRALTVDASGSAMRVLADGQSTESNNRDKVLKAANPASVAVKYGELISMKRAERSDLVRGMDVVYIYHDTIDAAGHEGDSKVFDACEDAIVELKNLVRIIVNELSGVSIVITSDHGFLYTHNPLQETDKVDHASFKGQDIELGRRYAITQKGAVHDFLMPVQFMDTRYDGFAPRDAVRLKMQGGGANFVHGGISLQEMCVPVIEYHYLRNQSKEYQRNKNKYDTKPVTVKLLSASHKVSNMIFQLNFYQEDAVGSNREPMTYSVYFTDSDGKVISDVQKIIADKTSTNIQERQFRCSFNLKNQAYKATSTYFLVIADENGMPASKEEFQIDIAFATDGFDFFG